MDKRNRIKG